MNKQAIITILLTLVAVAGQGQVRCHVIGTVAEGTTPIELRIYRDGEDPKNSTLRPVLKNGKIEYDKKAAKSLTPKQARNNTSASRSTITRGYEPID
jgi:hypothetical protein